MNELNKLSKRKEANAQMREIAGRKELYFIVHYSCESFDKADGKTPRVTSIAIRNFKSGQTQSFSIFQEAEIKRIDPPQIEANYDVLEKIALDKFYDFVRKNAQAIYVHWNMRDVNYGFPAIEHRYRVLNGYPAEIAEANKIDLARVLISLFGLRYIGHPRLENLVAFNNISDLNFLGGKAEAQAFVDKDFLKLHQSTLRKVDIMANIIDRVLDGTLKTQSKWADRHGVHPKVIYEFAVNHWVISLILLIIAVASGLIQIYQAVK